MSDCELLALYVACWRVRFFPEVRCFTAYTDRKPLTFAFIKISDPWSPQRQRQLAYISECTTDVRHIVRKDNNVADALSCTPIHAINVQMGIDYTAMACNRKDDEDVQAYRTARTRLVLKKEKFEEHDNSSLCDISTGQPEPIVPLAGDKRYLS